MNHNIAKSHINGLTVSTILLPDGYFETAVISGTKVDVVDRCQTIGIAKDNHMKWTETAEHVEWDSSGYSVSGIPKHAPRLFRVR